ncbi:MAG: glutamine-hydrolyzing carbamoyl-phosphate synthase small subunit [Dehalococcoidia bacterium]|nr:MAG: glutamine-hydrolyzing carbamoyl-phosphate synthase small subunit [Dehalococcoidia bacterium]
MPKKAILILEDGSVYEGHSFGADVQSYGEVVFNTSMTGYQEVLTDPSYAGQIVALTYPLIGNYGINPVDIESKRIQVSGFVVREDCPTPSHWQSTSTLAEYLAEADIPGIGGVDTRALTRRLRLAGVMMGVITTDTSPEEALKQLKSLPYYGDVDFVKGVSTEASYEWEQSSEAKTSGHHVVVVDCGLKYNILRILREMDCRVTAVPCTMSVEDILALNPDGILLSPGPGDPALLDYMVKTVQKLVGKKPIMGICLGLQLLGRAFGAETFKLKFGHRGANHPVRELETGRVYITAQNHGYAVDADTLKRGLGVSHINLNDGTVEGLRHRELPIFAIQYHSEASPGPQDNVYLFQQFVEMMGEACRR